MIQLLIISQIFIFLLWVMYLNERSNGYSHIFILLTKLGILKWKKRVFVEQIRNDEATLYKTMFRDYEITIHNTTMYSINYCYVEIQKVHYVGTDTCYYLDNGRRSENNHVLLKYLNKIECEKYIPDFILKNKKMWNWNPANLNIIREIKLKRITNV